MDMDHPDDHNDAHHTAIAYTVEMVHTTDIDQPGDHNDLNHAAIGCTNAEPSIEKSTAHALSDDDLSLIELLCGFQSS